MIIESFSLAGYRSFGKNIQRFDTLSKINLFIGQNNSGKSNILRFIHDIYPLLSQGQAIKFNPLDRHLPTGANFVVGLAVSLKIDDLGNHADFNQKITSKFPENVRGTQAPGYALRVFQKKSESDESKYVWFDFGNDLKLIDSSWKMTFDILEDREINSLWKALTGQSGGGREQHWYPESIRRLAPNFTAINSVMIPAIRKVGNKGSISEDFSGEGIIERLVRLQNPDVLKQEDRNKFKSINRFLRNVLDNETATIEIPHERDTILVHMDGKTLPLESLGTGIHEVIILAAAATILENTAICMEEPELHLNPILQKKLVRYLLESTKNQYFITTHSAALMDTPNAEIYHINLEQGESRARRATSDRHKSEVCENLGYHPSDLLQANCIIWVEGPSDRIYLNSWIHFVSPALIEGIHYSIMFYGGRLASHLSADDMDEMVEDFISLRRLNRRSVILIDSDKEKPKSRINATKTRLSQEFNAGPGYAWITDGREIENYLPPDQIRAAINETKPSARINSSFEKYANTLSIITKGGDKAQASKVDVAKHITKKFEPNFDILDLKKQVLKLISFIKESNPIIHPGG
ncbi:MAG: hypothetical protein CVU69_01840 [Deltaproteobacteria bacterium HGW-Deltaproteobacteria-4]|nr:MAG: hypothetical protein CVU69_01840 [Deltaproteobacteria bacterium HGW-Deltaproteobacteria-4]